MPAGGAAKPGQFCRAHPNEQIRYYCRDDRAPLCADCVVAHSKHEFVQADFKAASEVRSSLN